MVISFGISTLYFTSILPVDRIALEYAMEIVVLTPVSLWIYAPTMSAPSCRIVCSAYGSSPVFLIREARLIKDGRYFVVLNGLMS